MKRDPNNPSANELPKGISETSLVAAIEASGYPLQGVVADELARQQFGVEEEWDYIDDDTDERRNIDVFAFRRLSEPEKRWDNDAAIVLLIECKKSRHPYVFFRRMTPARLAGLPAVAGLRTVTIGESKPRNARYREMSPSEALGLSDLAFRAQGPAECS